MPKPTFYNLSEDKRAVLLRAAKKEFSASSLQEASIANIVKTAGIPRGSFYQYFEGKEDVYFYLLEVNLQENEDLFRKAIEQNEGDLFETFITMFHTNLMNFESLENRDFFRNMMLNMNHKVEKAFASSMREQRQQELMQLASKINIGRLSLQHPQELFHLLNIIHAVTFHNLTQHFVNEWSVDEALSNYKQELNLIKRGVYNNEGETSI
ncbi:TetR family transcriptional regulator [Paenibacillus sp. GCM10023252]|uniref:TetR family transcriptional regulator n=1 Tax=Paenibacillus sp. GCM10023252 TaxID=3252649 RepID=UPI0036140647